MNARIVTCASCGAKNRVGLDKLREGKAAVCGKCKAALPVSLEPMVVTDADFGAIVERADVAVLVDLWAPWCGPCRMIAPILNQLAKRMAGRVQFVKLNIDESPRTAGRFNVNSIPTLLMFKGGREADRIVGLRSEAELVKWIEGFAK